jgi:hypothetical protein
MPVTVLIPAVIDHGRKEISGGDQAGFSSICRTAASTAQKKSTGNQDVLIGLQA